MTASRTVSNSAFIPQSQPQSSSPSDDQSTISSSMAITSNNNNNSPAIAAMNPNSSGQIGGGSDDLFPLSKDVIEDSKLLFGIIYSLRNFVSKLSKNP